MSAVSFKTFAHFYIEFCSVNRIKLDIGLFSFQNLFFPIIFLHHFYTVVA